MISNCVKQPTGCGGDPPYDLARHEGEEHNFWFDHMVD